MCKEINNVVHVCKVIIEENFVIMWLKVKEYARRKNFSGDSLSSASSIRESDEDTCQHQVNAFYALFFALLLYTLLLLLFIRFGWGGGGGDS